VVGTGIAQYVQDGATGLATSLNTPAGVAFSADGSLYIAELQAGRIRLWNASLDRVFTIAGTGVPQTNFGTVPIPVAGINGSALVAQLTLPSAVHLTQSGGVPVLVLSDGYTVRAINLRSGAITLLAGMVSAGSYQSNIDDGRPGTQTFLAIPSAVAVDSTGRVLVTSEGGNSLRSVSLSLAQYPQPAGIVTAVIGQQGGT